MKEGGRGRLFAFQPSSCAPPGGAKRSCEAGARKWLSLEVTMFEPDVKMYESEKTKAGAAAPSGRW